MKQVVIVVVCVAMVGWVTMCAVCRNNVKGSSHLTKQKNKNTYECLIKPMEKYGRSANKFYTNGMCNFCGCPSDLHYMP